MAFGSRTLPTKVVEVPGGEPFTVRGLNSFDIGAIFSRNRQASADLFDRYRKQAQGDLSEAVNAADLIKFAPRLLADVIATATDEDATDEAVIAYALGLPLGTQVDALDQIQALTFQSGGGPGKFLATVIRAAQATTSLMSDLKT